MIVPIDRLGDPRIDEYTQLTDMQMRKVREPAEGIFLAEGEKVIRRALAAGLRMTSALMEPKWLPGLRGSISDEVPVYLADLDLLTQITGFRLHRGALAVFARPAAPEVADVLEDASTVVLLEDLVDHTNVGAVFRSATGLGVDAVLVTARCADPWYRRSVKTSMGAVFSMPWTRVEDTAIAIAGLRDRGFTTVALDPKADVSIRDWRPTGPTALLLGTEGEGLSAAARSRCDRLLAIPMRHRTDSLNVAAAAAVACYALTTPVEQPSG